MDKIVVICHMYHTYKSLVLEDMYCSHTTQSFYHKVL